MAKQITIYTRSCGCMAKREGEDFDLEYCPLHKAAPAMRDALDWALPFVAETPLPPNDQRLRDRFASKLRQAEQALAQAHGEAEPDAS